MANYAMCLWTQQIHQNTKDITLSLLFLKQKCPENIEILSSFGHHKFNQLNALLDGRSKLDQFEASGNSNNCCYVLLATWSSYLK